MRSRLLAVLDLRSKLKGEDASQVDPSYFGDLVRAAALRAARGLNVMTRENLVVLLKAAGKDLAQCEGECEVETGRKIGADLVISGEMLRVGSSLKMSLKLHETHQGRLLAGSVATGRDIDELDRQASKAVDELCSALR